MSPEHAQPNDPATPSPVPTNSAEPVSRALEGVLTADDIHAIQASGLTLGDVINEIETELKGTPQETVC